jgi:hypothetical protein
MKLSKELCSRRRMPKNVFRMQMLTFGKGDLSLYGIF